MEQGQPSEPECPDLLSQLLQTRNIQSLEHLNHILFDQTESHDYVKQSKRKLSTHKSDLSPMKTRPFQQLCAQYCNKEESLPDIKRILRYKYVKEDVFQSHQLRKSMWMLLSRAIFKIEQFQHFYQELLGLQYPEYYCKIIQNDVKRTMERGAKGELQQIGEGQRQSLKNILRCISIKNPYLGYCQGMNFILNFLLNMTFTEQQCFWISLQLFQQILPKNYYTNMLGIAIDIKLIQIYLKLKKPQIYHKLQQLNITISIFALQWFVCLCTTILPYNVLILLWDLMFCQGSVVLVKGIIVIVEEMGGFLGGCCDLNDFLVGLEGFKKGLQFQEFQFLDRIKKVYINRNLLNFARRVYQTLLKIQNNSKKRTPKPCNPQWPICHYQLHQDKILQADPEPWVFKQDGPPKIIENYLDIKAKQGKVQKEDNREKTKKLMVGRMPHTCQPEAYEMLQQIKTNIELSDYDPQTNSYVTPSSLSEMGLRFLHRATIMDDTFVFSVPNNK